MLSKLDSTNLLAEIESQIVETDKKIRELQNQQNPPPNQVPSVAPTPVQEPNPEQPQPRQESNPKPEPKGEPTPDQNPTQNQQQLNLITKIKVVLKNFVHQDKINGMQKIVIVKVA